MDIPVVEIIPQRKPFILIDELLFCDRDVSRTSYLVRPEAIFVTDGELDTAGIIENMAQTAVARIGYLAKYVDGGRVTIGYIGNVHNLKVLRRPKVGETLITEVTLKNVVMGIAMSEARVVIGGETIAEASIKTAQAE